ncbi:MAG: PaaI family thioesterase [Terracidiphilus sp.]
MKHSAQSRCFGCGPANATGLQLVCLSAILENFEGPHGYVHGGIIATLLDEAMSKSVRARGVTAVTGQMEVQYLRPVHSVAPIRLEGRWLRGEGRKHWSEARILDSRGRVLAKATGVFIEIDGSHGY